ncbi:MAG TPA: M6 family metalloprotease domain-containing protein, partial [Polyangiaceae bacterium]
MKASLLGLSLAMLSLPALGAPYAGQSFELEQPDGSQVPVVVYGDEFYQHIESPEGYTLVRDSGGWICYAQLNAAGTDLVATGVRYGVTQRAARGSGATALPSQKHIKLAPQVVRAKAQQTKNELNAVSGLAAPAGRAKAAAAAAPAPRVGAIRGLTLVIDFADEPGTVPQEEINNFCNLPGYNSNGNNGSIRDYYYEVSGGQLEYTNTVTAYYTAALPKSYYDSDTVPYGSTAQELIVEALTALDAKGFDFSTLSTDSDGNLLILNALYAGFPTWGWSKGLWPHASGIGGRFSADGVNANGYQITNIGTALSIRTFIHENGHALCGWPDLYDYDYDS